MLYFPLVTLQLLVNCLSDKKPLKSKYKEQKKPNPEIKASFLRKLFFLWFDSFAWMGYRKPLTTDDMWDIRPEDTTFELISEFDKHWLESVEKGKQKASNTSKANTDDTTKKLTNVCHQNNIYALKDSIISILFKGSILPAMFKTFGGPFYFAGILKLALDLLAFASPQLLKYFHDSI